MGAVVDVHFDGESAADSERPAIDKDGGVLVLEVAQHSGRKHGRAASRWMRPKASSAAQEVTDTGAPIEVPVGPETLGRIVNVIGEPIDERGPIETHRPCRSTPAPEFVDQSTETETAGHRHQGRRPAHALRQGR